MDLVLFCVVSELEIRAGLVRWFLMAYGSAWDMKEQGAIGKTGHQWDYFSLSGIRDRKWALGKMVYRGHGICEKYPFDLSPPPHFPHSRRSCAQRTEHQHSLPGGHEDQDDEEHEKVKALWTRRAHGMDDSHGSRGLDPGDSRRSFRLARLGLFLKSCPLHQITPTTSVLPGIAWRDSAIFVVLVDSPY